MLRKFLVFPVSFCLCALALAQPQSLSPQPPVYDVHGRLIPHDGPRAEPAEPLRASKVGNKQGSKAAAKSGTKRKPKAGARPVRKKTSSAQNSEPGRKSKSKSKSKSESAVKKAPRSKPVAKKPKG